jgi:hypothetical protein
MQRVTDEDHVIHTTNAPDLAHRIHPKLRHLVPVFSDLDEAPQMRARPEGG